MKNYLQFRDTVNFKPIEIERQNIIKDNFLGQMQNRPLIVKIAASHAGLITRNNGFYMPDKMRKGASSFTSQYNKPIQIHHNDEKDPVGRVIKAQYIETNPGVSNLVNKLQNSWGDFTSGKMDRTNSINFICDILNQKDSLLDDPDFQGAGYLEITAAISDPDAIQKVIDGRYLTGSVGLTTDAAVCSVCKQDWVQTDYEERCAHRPGKMYDGKKAFVITGNLNYDEYSFVNTPADRHSRVMEINVNGQTDKVNMDDSLGKTIAVNIITDNIQEDKMFKSVATKLSSDPRFAILGDETIKELLASLEDEKAFVEKWPQEDEIDFTVEFEAFLDKTAIEKFYVRAFEDQEISTRTALLLAIRPDMEASAVTEILTDVDKISTFDKFYDILNQTEWNDYSELEDEVLVKFVEENKDLQDAKLSTSARKRLPSSSFCGPNKSFPVSDCAHVIAARRLIGRASVSSATKSKILACVSRKSSAMGCSAKGKDAVVETPVVQNQTEDCACKESDAKIKELTDQLATITTEKKELHANFILLHENLAATKISWQTELDATKKDLDATRAEYKAIQDDLTQMADQLFTATEEATNYLVDNIVVLRVLSGEVIEDLVKTKDAYKDLTKDAIKTELTGITQKVDMKKIADSINSGLTRLPNGSVTDPTGNSTKKVYDKKVIEKISNEYMRIKLGGSSPYGRGQTAADRFKQDMQNKGLLPNG